MQALMTRPELQLAEPGAKHLALGLALLFLGKQEASEATLEVRLRLTFRRINGVYVRRWTGSAAAESTGFRAVSMLSLVSNTVCVSDPGIDC